MSFLSEISLAWNIVIFAAAALTVWGAGVRLSRYADKIIDRSDASEVFVGSLGLAVITSLPEVATTVSATIANDASLAVNNLFGSIALQVVVLVAADAYTKKTSLSSLLDNPVSRLQAISLIFLLAIAAVAVLYQDISIFHVGVWSIVLFVFYVALSYMVNYFKGIHWWITEPSDRESIGKVKSIVQNKRETASDETEKDSVEKEKLSQVLFSHLGLLALGAAVVVLLGGYLVATNADVIAKKTGISSSFMGFFFVGITTSLPELSTTLSAVKLGRYRMAFSNIFGTNLLNVGMIFLADLFYTSGAVLNEVDKFAALAALLGIMLTAVYLIGLSIRLKKAYFNLGVDSLLVLILYVVGSIVLLNV